MILIKNETQNNKIILRTSSGNSCEIDFQFHSMYRKSLFDLLLPLVSQYHQLNCTSHIAQQNHDKLKEAFYNYAFDKQIIIPNKPLQANDIICFIKEYISKITTIIMHYKYLIDPNFCRSVNPKDIPQLDKLINTYSGICAVTSMLHLMSAKILLEMPPSADMTINQQYTKFLTIYNHSHLAITILYSIFPSNQMLIKFFKDSSFLMTLLNINLSTLFQGKNLIEALLDKHQKFQPPYSKRVIFENLSATIKYVNDIIEFNHKNLRFEDDITACDYFLTHKLNYLNNICKANIDFETYHLIECCIELLSRHLLLLLVNQPKMLIKHITTINQLLALTTTNSSISINNAKIKDYNYFLSNEHANTVSLRDLQKNYLRILYFLTDMQNNESLFNKLGTLIYHLTLYTQNIHSWPIEIRNNFSVELLIKQSQLSELNLGYTKSNITGFKMLSSAISYRFKESFFYTFHHLLMQIVQTNFTTNKYLKNPTPMPDIQLIDVYQELLYFKQINLSAIYTDDQLSDYWTACYKNKLPYNEIKNRVIALRYKFINIHKKCVDMIANADKKKISQPSPFFIP